MLSRLKIHSHLVTLNTDKFKFAVTFDLFFLISLWFFYLAFKSNGTTCTVRYIWTRLQVTSFKGNLKILNRVWFQAVFVVSWLVSLWVWTVQTGQSKGWNWELNCSHKYEVDSLVRLVTVEGTDLCLISFHCRVGEINHNGLTINTCNKLRPRCAHGHRFLHTVYAGPLTLNVKKALS